MKDLRYFEGVVTLGLDEEKCVGCGECTLVCPHGVLEMNGRKVIVADGGACMECGACALNCAPAALTVNPGVGCAAYIIQSWIKGKNQAACC